MSGSADAPAWRCETCEWWELPYRDTGDEGDAGRCLYVENGPAPLRAYVGEIGGSLYTQRDFGCVQWEKRE